MRTFTILGAGWLGLAYAKNLREKYKIILSSSNEDKKLILKKEGFEAYVLNEDELSSLDKLLQTDYLLINFPPSKFKDYLVFLKKIYENKNLNKIKKIIFISSTSIYPNKNTLFKEDYKISNSISPLVYEAEKVIKDKTDVIFRCAGLMGYNRIAGKYFANKKVDNARKRVNYVHRDDVIEAINFSINNEILGVFNLCSYLHPTKEEIYVLNSEKYNFKKPIFTKEGEYKSRLIDGSKIESFGFKYKYPNPFYYL